MNYKIKCPNCKEEVNVSSHGAVKYLDDTKRLRYSWECPKCEGEIEGITGKVKR